MTDTDTTSGATGGTTSGNAYGPRPPLGVGGLISASFSVLFRRFWLFLLLGLLVILGYFLIVALVFGGAAAGLLSASGNLAGGGVAELLAGGGGVVLGVLLFVSLILVSTFTQAYQTAAGHDVFLGIHHGWGHYFNVGLRRMVPLFVVYLAVILVMGAALFGIGAAMIAIGLPGWLTALVVMAVVLAALVILSVAIPAIVVENRWFSAIGRAWHLTEGYRWPVAGFIVTMILISLGIALAFGAVIGGLGATIGGDFGVGIVIAQILNFAVQILVTALFLIAYAVLFTRLRTIKEGAPTDDLAATFD